MKTYGEVTEKIKIFFKENISIKEIYLDIMEKALSAYTDKKITEYIDEVKVGGLT